MDAIRLTMQAMAADSGITGLVPASRMFAVVLPEHIEPTGGAPAIVIHYRGGTTHPEMPIQQLSVGITIWAGINKFVEAHAVYNKIFTALHGIVNTTFGTDGTIISCLEGTPGQDIIDPDTGWATVVCFYEMIIRQ